MHYHAEIIMPQTTDVEAAIAKYMRGFYENDDDSGKSAFWDWYQIGGRYGGRKVEALCDEKKIAAFYAELNAAKVTVSGMQWGKQELQPADQQSFVDSVWVKHFPDSPMKFAPMFKHSGQQIGVMDICKVSEIPDGLRAYTVMICGEADPVTLLHEGIWNGCTHQKTDWSGNVKDALALHAKQLNIYGEEYRKKVTVRDDWLCVTVDYHS